MEKIQEIWFENERIYMQSVSGKVFSRPLEAFPTLKDADFVQRQKFYIWGNGEYVRWKELDEDLSVESFFDSTEPNLNNGVAEIFNRCPWLSVKEVANFIGMPKAVLDRFIYGIWQPKEEVMFAIRNGIKSMSQELLQAVS
ncbi:MAG: DUF2442 domain-containing protein [Muribaculaceae bacterium]|nr:DUF2442 domain-containing protein [Muribaculaceae bacterium]